MKFAIVIVILALIGGIVFFAQTQTDKKLRIEEMAFKEQVAYAQEQHDEVLKALEGVDELGAEVWDVMAQASNMIPAIVGAENAIRVYDKNYMAKKSHEEFKKTLTETKLRKPEEIKKDNLKTGVIVDEMGREAPAGFTSRSMQEKRDKLEAARRAKTAAVSKSSLSAPTSEKDKRVAACQKLIESVYGRCDNVESRLMESRKLIEQSSAVLGLVKGAKSAANARAQQEGFKVILTSAKGIKTEIKAEIGEAKKVIPLLKDMKVRVEEEKAKAAAAAERQRLAEQKAAQKKRELAMAADWYNGKPALLKAYNFAQAAEELKTLHDSLTFDEAKAIVKIPAERYRLLAGLLKWLEGQFNKEPMSWGWKTATGALDIEKANAEGIFVQGKVIPWTKIPKTRLVGFVKHYLKASEDVGRDKADLYIGIALFCKTFDLAEDIDGFLDQAGIESDHAAAAIPALMNFKQDESVLDE